MIIVKNRELLIPNNERYIGTTYDNDTENRVFQVPRFSQRGVDLANLTFRLDIQYANEAFDTVVLGKEVGEAFIILVWRITSATLQVPGTLYIGLRAIDDEATVKWSSFSAAMYAERHLNTPGNYGGSLTEIEQIEQDHQYMKGVVDELKANIDYAHDAEAWAQGTRSGTAVPSTDKTYHKNSKYYSEQASAKATQAANSATAAANSANQAAETVADTNTRFNNAMAGVTSETEVIDARVGADGTTYPVLKTRLDTEHTQLKSQLTNATEESPIDFFARDVFNLLTTGTNNSVTFTKGDGIVTANGTATDGSAIRTFIYPGMALLPSWVVPGKPLRIYVSTSDTHLRFAISFFDSNNDRIGEVQYITAYRLPIVPENTVKVAMFLNVPQGATVTNATISIKIYKSIYDLQAMDELESTLIANRSGTLIIEPMAHYRYTQDGVTAVDFSTMPLNTYVWCEFSVVKSALLNANFPLSWSDTDNIHMVRLAAGLASIGVSIIRIFNFTKIQSAEMLYFATSSGNKYRWVLPTNNFTKQYFPADAKAVGDALALKANITDLRLTDAIGPMVSVAETYFDVGYAKGTNLVYQQKHYTGLMAYNPYYIYDGQTWGTDEDYDGKPCIHCAQFVMALLKGIRYQDSRYVTGIQGKNKISQWAWSPDHLYPINYGGTQWANFSEGPVNGYTDGYMDLKAMADYAQSHGLLRSMEEHDINVSPGDLIFEGHDVESISDLGHVSIALHVGMESKNVQIVESWSSIKYDGSGVGIRTRTVSFSDIDYYASLPLKASSYTYEIICNIETQKSIPSQHETSMNVYRLNNISFRPGFYTFVMQADVIGETNPYVTYKLPDSKWFTFQYFVNSSGNYITTVYISSELVDNDVQINIPANVGIDANKLIVVKGYINTDIN